MREVRGKGSKSLVIGPTDELGSFFVPELKRSLTEKPRFQMREDVGRVKNEEGVGSLLKLGKRHELVSYNGLNYVMVKFELPLRQNI